MKKYCLTEKGKKEATKAITALGIAILLSLALVSTISILPLLDYLITGTLKAKDMPLAYIGIPAFLIWPTLGALYFKRWLQNNIKEC